jgi:molybdopterin molybdotransferase
VTAPRDPPRHDVRLRGFPDRASVERALAWVDRHAPPLGSEEVALADACGRVLAAAPAAPADHPPVARAAADGYAVRSADTVGASAYNPLPLRLQGADGPLAPGGAALLWAGAALPAGADALLGFDAAEAAGEAVEAIAAVAEGAGVERPGDEVRAGAAVGAAGRPLRLHEAALLAALGVARASVVARPRVRLVVAGAKGLATAGAAADVDGQLVRALVARDGGLAEVGPPAATLREALLRAAERPADLVLALGRTGTGPDDEAPVALAAAGELGLHGVALRPGGSTAMGHVAGVPVLLLPGDPLACLVAYELFAGRFVRRLGGRDPELPHPAREAEVSRRIVSAVGCVDVCQVRLVGGAVEPLGVAEFGGLAAAARADGFVVVPAPLEGYPPGARVIVRTY